MPQLLRDAVISAEDKRFLSHGGVDWIARASAILQTLYRGYFVRGASTITEQTVRIVRPRKRTLWSRWVEGFEASDLERRSSKGEILEFYMNQLPYRAQRRGVAEAAQYYFDRDLDSLSKREMIALAIIPRAPRWFDPKRYLERLDDRIDDLVERMVRSEMISPQIALQIKQEPLRVARDRKSREFDATHFVSFLKTGSSELSGPVRTTIDASLQSSVQRLIDRRIRNLATKNVTNGAVLVVDHRSKEILAYVVSGALHCYSNESSPNCAYDAVRVPRQPGSSMKPFLYSLALERGWTAATIIRDEPLSNEVGSGRHRFKNYSRVHYGDVTVRQALGNSLNIPAVLAIKFTGVGEYYSLLKKLGFDSLREQPEFYDVGLALGSGEVTLFELVRAYGALASGGKFGELRASIAEASSGFEQPISAGVASIVSDILSDKSARELEFGTGGILNHPVQTAVKTGTSTDFKDSWAIGYDSRYVVGVWMGNLDGTPTDGLTGSTGPALVMRSTFNELRRNSETAPLSISPDIHIVKVKANGSQREELMTGAMVLREKEILRPHTNPHTPRVTFPSNGLMMAYDPRLPPELQAVRFRISGVSASDVVTMEIDGKELTVESSGSVLWHLSRGTKRLVAKVQHADGTRQELPPVEFLVR
jgi:penicillin-binding protein 1C